MITPIEPSLLWSMTGRECGCQMPEGTPGVQSFDYRGFRDQATAIGTNIDQRLQEKHRNGNNVAGWPAWDQVGPGLSSPSYCCNVPHSFWTISGSTANTEYSQACQAIWKWYVAWRPVTSLRLTEGPVTCHVVLVPGSGLA
jgi:hypothetical protein